MQYASLIPALCIRLPAEGHLDLRPNSKHSKPNEQHVILKEVKNNLIFGDVIPCADFWVAG